MERITPVGTVGHWILSVLLPFGFSCSTVRTQERGYKCLEKDTLLTGDQVSE